jgi:hypothetical protein
MGVFYPKPPAIPKFAHHSIAWTYAYVYYPGELPTPNFTFEDAMRDFRASGCDTLFLSSEDFLLATFHEGYLDSIFRDLRSCFDKVLVTAYVRNRKDFFTSSYNEWVKSLSYSGDFDNYFSTVLKGQQATMHYTKSLCMWAERADEASYLPFHSGPSGLSVEKRLLKSLGLCDEDLLQLRERSTGPVNASIGSMAILAFRRVAERLATCEWFDPHNFEKRSRLKESMISDVEAVGWNEQRLRVFNPERVQAMKSVFGDDDQIFSQQFFDADWREVYPDELECEAVTELNYEDMGQAECAMLSEFEKRSIDNGARIFQTRGRSFMDKLMHKLQLP